MGPDGTPIHLSELEQKKLQNRASIFSRHLNPDAPPMVRFVGAMPHSPGVVRSINTHTRTRSTPLCPQPLPVTRSWREAPGRMPRHLPRGGPRMHGTHSGRALACRTAPTPPWANVGIACYRRETRAALGLGAQGQAGSLPPRRRCRSDSITLRLPGCPTGARSVAVRS